MLRNGPTWFLFILVINMVLPDILEIFTFFTNQVTNAAMFILSQICISNCGPQAFPKPCDKMPAGLTRDRFDRQSHWLPCLRLHVVQAFSIFFVSLLNLVVFGCCATSWFWLLETLGHISLLYFTDGSNLKLNDNFCLQY